MYLRVSSSSIPKAGQSGRHRRQISRGSSLGLEGDLGLLLGIKGLLLDLSLGLQSIDQVLVAPADLLRQVAQQCEAAIGSHSNDLQRSGDNDALLGVIRSGDALEALQK